MLYFKQLLPFEEQFFIEWIQQQFQIPIQSMNQVPKTNKKSPFDIWLFYN